MFRVAGHRWGVRGCQLRHRWHCWSAKKIRVSKSDDSYEDGIYFLYVYVDCCHVNRPASPVLASPCKREVYAMLHIPHISPRSTKHSVPLDCASHVPSDCGCYAVYVRNVTQTNRNVTRTTREDPGPETKKACTCCIPPQRTPKLLLQASAAVASRPSTARSAPRRCSAVAWRNLTAREAMQMQAAKQCPWEICLMPRII